MITSKHIGRIVAGLVGLCLLLCGFIVYAADAFDTAQCPEYEKRLFGDEIITLDIQADEDEWQALLDNAQSKEWISADLILNGERFSNVGVRTKGNSSLSQSSDKDRYSLHIKFNHFVKGQTYYGLDTFCVNNLVSDATYMKDTISYDIMKFLGVPAPLANYANVRVNGEHYGFCLALERYDKAFLDRVYGTSSGQLYSVKIGMGMRGNFEGNWQDIENEMPARRQANGAFNGNRGGGMAMGGFGGGNGGGSLLYTDDEISSYSAIFNNAVFGSVTDSDKKRVIKAIENLSTGTDLEKYFDVDEILRYFAAHTVVVNLDSYISNMQQNYYLYERDGKIIVLPWDYDLAFGGFQTGDASGVVNFPIDTPVSGVSMEDRPLLSELLQVDEYLERYHEYLRQIVEGYFESGLFEDTLYGIDMSIHQYVREDMTAFYTYEQYEASLSTLIELGRLRALSIKGQLDGTIPSTQAGQNADQSALIDASAINLSALGSMMGGRGGGWNWQDTGRDGEFPMPGGNFDMGAMFDMEMIGQAMQILMETDGELTGEAKEALLALGLTEEQIDMYSGMQRGFPGNNMFGNRAREGEGQDAFPGGSEPNTSPGGNTAGGAPWDASGGSAKTPPQGMNRPGADGNSASVAATPGGTEYAVTVLALLAILAGAIVFVAKPRKNVI